MSKYFEEIIVSLVSAQQRSRKELHKTLKNIGYTSEDDYYLLDRVDDVKPWQSTELLTLDIKCSNKLKYETEADIEEGLSTKWDEIVVSYLMATTPQENIETFVATLGELIRDLNLALIYETKEISLSLLRETLGQIATNLAQNYASVGSEDLAILIEEDYL